MNKYGLRGFGGDTETAPQEEARLLSSPRGEVYYWVTECETPGAPWLMLTNGLGMDHTVYAGVTAALSDMWLLGDERVPDHSTLSRFRKRFALEIEDLFYQYARYLDGLGETDHGTVFIDGTKLESRAGKYSFCWRKSVEKQLGKLREKTGCKTLKQAKKKLGQMSLCVEFVSGKGKRKSPEQREYEAFAELCRRWEGYDHSLCVMV